MSQGSWYPFFSNTVSDSVKLSLKLTSTEKSHTKYPRPNKVKEQLNQLHSPPSHQQPCSEFLAAAFQWSISRKSTFENQLAGFMKVRSISS